MQIMDDEAPGFYLAARKYVSKRPVAWLFSHFAHHVDRGLMWLTNGRYSAGKLLFGMPIICLTTTGARSGQPRTVPLLAVPDGENIILVASNWGQGHHPGWYYNVRANPEVLVEHNGVKSPYIARQAAGEEREGKWGTAVRFYPGYEAYKKWAKGREIPVFVLLPQENR